MNAVIISLHEEHDPQKREKILAFFNRYLPLMTEVIDAGKHGYECPLDTIQRFTDIVKSFSDKLYSAADTIDVNSLVLQGMQSYGIIQVPMSFSKDIETVRFHF